MPARRESGDISSCSSTISAAGVGATVAEGRDVAAPPCPALGCKSGVGAIVLPTPVPEAMSALPAASPASTVSAVSEPFAVTGNSPVSGGDCAGPASSSGCDKPAKLLPFRLSSNAFAVCAGAVPAAPILSAVADVAAGTSRSRPGGVKPTAISPGTPSGRLTAIADTSLCTVTSGVGVRVAAVAGAPTLVSSCPFKGCKVTACDETR